MANYVLYAVIIDIDTTQVAKVDCNLSVSELHKDQAALKSLIGMLAENEEAWTAVLAGKRAAVVFDSATLEEIRINRGSKFFIM